MHSIKKLATLIVALMMAMALVACGGSSGSSGSSSGSSTSDAASSASASASSILVPGETVGSPWASSNLAGNLPKEQPELKNDIYAHYDYDYLSSHQAQPSSMMADYSGEPQMALTQIIGDESKNSHDLEQLRVLYNQASDVDTLQKSGHSEVQPYIDRIDGVSSLDEMNELLKADDFPFSPFVIANLTVNDTRTTNIVAVNPNLILFDALVDGGTYYQDSDDAKIQEDLDAALKNAAQQTAAELMAAGMTHEEVKDQATRLIAFEKSHAKNLDASATFLKADYGAMAESARESYVTLDELCALCPNFPMRETLEKCGKANSPTYVIPRKWVEGFNGLWTAENLDMIKLAAKAKVLGETRPFRDPTAANDVLKSFGWPTQDTQTFAYSACNNLDTFAQVLAKTYTDNSLGASATERLTTLSKNLIDEYKDLIGNTAWMGEESRARIVEKLDHMTLNVLEPQGGYFDYSALELDTADKGGTLFSNYLKLMQYRRDCESRMVGQPAVASSAWFSMNPMRGSAFYDSTSNSINIYPGYVTSLYYTDGMSETELLGGVGFTIGHEISHAFDYMGSQIDAYGQPNPVFSDADVDSFVLKSSTLAMYYKGIELYPGVNVDGQNVVGEAAADLSGMQVVLAFSNKVDGFDYAAYLERFSNVWARVMSEETFKLQIVDVHPMENLRVNVNAQMFDQTYDTLGVSEGDAMYLAPNERILIWGPNA